MIQEVSKAKSKLTSIEAKDKLEIDKAIQVLDTEVKKRKHLVSQLTAREVKIDPHVAQLLPESEIPYCVWLLTGQT
jgi:hypothetical protein